MTNIRGISEDEKKLLVSVCCKKEEEKKKREEGADFVSWQQLMETNLHTTH